MLNDAQIEAAARKLCEIRGNDPGEETPYGHYDVLTESMQRMRREDFYAREIRAYLQVQEAVAFAVSESQKAAFDATMAPPFCPPPGPCKCGHSHSAHWASPERICTNCACGDYSEALR